MNSKLDKLQIIAVIFLMNRKLYRFKPVERRYFWLDHYDFKGYWISVNCNLFNYFIISP